MDRITEGQLLARFPDRDKPDALIVGIESIGVLDIQGVKLALATALFRDGHLSLARAARLAEMPFSRFVTYVSRLGIPVVNLDPADAARDLETLDEWLASS